MNKKRIAKWIYDDNEIIMIDHTSLNLKSKILLYY